MRVAVAKTFAVAAVIAAGLIGCSSKSNAAAADWPTYQQSNGRAGVDVGAPTFSGLKRRFIRQLDGQVYAQPLTYNGNIYVATESNSVYAFSNSGRRLFYRH